MNPARPSAQIHRPRLVVLLTLVAALFITSGCEKKKGGDDDDKDPSNEWDEMKWDEGEGGAVELRLFRVVIA